MKRTHETNPRLTHFLKTRAVVKIPRLTAVAQEKIGDLSPAEHEVLHHVLWTMYRQRNFSTLAWPKHMTTLLRKLERAREEESLFHIQRQILLRSSKNGKPLCIPKPMALLPYGTIEHLASQDLSAGNVDILLGARTPPSSFRGTTPCLCLTIDGVGALEIPIFDITRAREEAALLGAALMMNPYSGFSPFVTLTHVGWQQESLRSLHFLDFLESDQRTLLLREFNDGFAGFQEAVVKILQTAETLEDPGERIKIFSKVFYCGTTT